MRVPPIRRLAAVPVSALLTTALFAAPAAAQRPETGVSPAGEALGAVLVTLVVGGGLIAFAPTFTDRTTRLVHKKPLETLLYGVGIGIGLVIVLVVLIVTIAGILLAIPLALVALVLSEIGYLAVGRVVSDDWGVALLVAMGASAIVGGVPIVGALLGIVLSSFGLGAAYLHYKDGGKSPPERPVDDGPNRKQG